MTNQIIVIVNGDPVFRDVVSHALTEAGYESVLHDGGAGVATTIAHEQPCAVVVNADDAPPTEEIVLALVEHDSHAEHIPVVVCGQHTQLRQDVVKSLQPRRGAVLASSLAPDELLAKLKELEQSQGSER
ncbi:MAG TPA: hypothetical protein VFZ66_04250 [Herpetosiphonaceae bacterium]